MVAVAELSGVLGLDDPGGKASGGGTEWPFGLGFPGSRERRNGGHMRRALAWQEREGQGRELANSSPRSRRD